MLSNTQELFKKLNIKETLLSSEKIERLNSDGYLVLDNIKFLKENVKKISEIANKLIVQEGDKGGWEGKEQFYKPKKNFEEGADRLGGLVNKHPLFKELIKIPEILLAAHNVIKNDIKICGLNLRNPKKGHGEQGIHIDGFARFSDEEEFSGVVVFVFLDDSNIQNGAIRVIPGTHKILGWPDDHINIHEKNKNEIRLEVKAGTAIIANLNLWHAGADNLNGKPRKSIMINIKNRKYGQLLNYKKYLSEDFINKLEDEEKYLLAVRKNDVDVDDDGSANKKRREYLSSQGKLTEIIQ